MSHHLRRLTHSVISTARNETASGALLLFAALFALVWANSAWSASYFNIRNATFGIESLGLSLTLGSWAADGLLAIFFFVVGLELKHEFVHGALRSPRSAAVPIAAAFGGVAVPALIHLVANANEPALRDGWAIPTATDIAFAVAVLTVVGRHLPGSLRIFLLTLAVVDDLVAILIIAVFYTSNIEVLPLSVSIAIAVAYAWITRHFKQHFLSQPLLIWLVLMPLGFVAWGFLHASGIHSTIAGVTLAFLVPIGPPADRSSSLAELVHHHVTPISALVALPVFAFFAAGVSVASSGGIGAALQSQAAWTVVAALVIGKPVGILLTTWLATRVFHSDPLEDVSARHRLGLGCVAGVGFTVSLLIAELSYPLAPAIADEAKIGVLAGSLLSAVIAAALLSGPRRSKQQAEA